MNRRNFLSKTAGITLAALNGPFLLPSGPATPLQEIPIVDTHQHLVDIKRFGKGWANPPVPGNYGIENYKKATRGLNVVKAVYMEVAVSPENRHQEAMYALELCRDNSNPTVAAVIKKDLLAEDFKDYMAQFKDSPIKGIRGSFTSPEQIQEDKIVENVQALGKMDFSFDFSVPTSWLSPMTVLVRSCPGTKFLVNHCGNVDPRAFLSPGELTGKADHDPEEWLADISTLAAEKNVVCKISGVVTRSPGYPLSARNLAPAINHCLDIFGPDRVMFASDWPWCLKSMDIRSWVEILKTVVENRSLEDQRKLFHDNAVNFYNI